jgi:protein ImuA
MQPAAALAVPHVWRVTDLARQDQVLPSGHAALDAQLPGGGWPLGHLVELLQERPEAHAWQLLLPALVARLRAQPGPAVLVGPPFDPYGPALAGQGLPAERLLWIRADRAAARLWSAEQALRCADVPAVLAWLPQVRGPELRRLHLAARQAGDPLLVVLRGLDARSQASPAPLRLALQGVDAMQVTVLKRRGPPLDAPLQLPAHAERVRALLAARRRPAGAPVPTPLPAETTTPPTPAPAAPIPRRPSHVLDRLVPQP